MPHLDFAVNHYGKPDVAMFDFTSMFQVRLGNTLMTFTLLMDPDDAFPPNVLFHTTSIKTLI